LVNEQTDDRGLQRAAICSAAVKIDFSDETPRKYLNHSKQEVETRFSLTTDE
jgi:hypothetical protein